MLQVHTLTADLPDGLADKSRRLLDIFAGGQPPETEADSAETLLPRDSHCLENPGMVMSLTL